jgi:hypothetical protein
VHRILQAEAERLIGEVADLKAQLHALETAPYPKIRAIDVSQNMAQLGKRCTKKEVVDMVWEVSAILQPFLDHSEPREVLLPLCVFVCVKR